MRAMVRLGLLFITLNRFAFVWPTSCKHFFSSFFCLLSLFQNCFTMNGIFWMGSQPYNLIANENMVIQIQWNITSVAQTIIEISVYTDAEGEFQKDEKSVVNYLVNVVKPFPKSNTKCSAYLPSFWFKNIRKLCPWICFLLMNVHSPRDAAQNMGENRCGLKYLTESGIAHWRQHVYRFTEADVFGNFIPLSDICFCIEYRIMNRKRCPK